MPTGAIADVRGRSGPLCLSIGLLSDPTASTRTVISVASMSSALSCNRSAYSSRQQRYLRTSIDPCIVGATPHLYSEDDITRLMDAVWRLQTVTPFRRATVYALIGLLASTGLRIGEALALNVDDVKLSADPPHLLDLQ